MAHLPSDLHCLLNPLAYMEIYKEKEDTESLKSCYKKEKVVNGYFDLMRMQQASKEFERGIFLSAFSNVFNDPPEQLNFSCVAMKKHDLKIRQKDPHTIVLSSIIHMEYLITKARKSGNECDYDLIKKFAQFLNAMDKESRDQEGLTLPVNYVKAVKFAVQYAKENRIKIIKEVDWEDFIVGSIAGESSSDAEYQQESEEEDDDDIASDAEYQELEEEKDDDDIASDYSSKNSNTKVFVLNDFELDDDCGSIEMEPDCGSIEMGPNNTIPISDEEDILIISDDDLSPDNDQAEVDKSRLEEDKEVELMSSSEEIQSPVKLPTDVNLEMEKSELKEDKEGELNSPAEEFQSPDKLDVEKSTLEEHKEMELMSSVEEIQSPSHVQLDVEKSKLKDKEVELINLAEEVQLTDNLPTDVDNVKLEEELSSENVAFEPESSDDHHEPESKKSKIDIFTMEEREGAQSEKPKYKYTLYKKKITEKIVKIINNNSYNFVITDNRCDLFMILINQNLMSIDNQDLIKLKNGARSFNTLKVTMEAWGKRETDTHFDSKIDHGSKVISIAKNGEIDLQSRKYRKRNLGTMPKDLQLTVFDCAGGKMCSNPQCPFLLRNLQDPLVGNVKNTTQFVVVSGDVISCVFCESQDVPNTLIEVMCSNSLYIVETTYGKDIYSLRNHSCQCIFKMDIPKEFASDFERHQIGYHEATKSAIRSMILEDNADSAEELYCKSSNFVAGAKFGTTLKRIAMKGKPFKIDLDALVKKLRDRDPNFILACSENITVVSSTRSLQLMYSELFHEYFIDVCFSKILASEKLCAVCLYTYDPMVRMVLKLASGYIKSENSQDISEFLTIINSAIGKQYSMESYRLRPQNMFVDYADSNKEAFLKAGYEESEVNAMLVGCESHFGDFVDRNIGFFNNGLDRSTFKQLSYEWRNSGTLTLADSRFKILRDFIVTKSTNCKTVQTALEWWASRPHLTLKMYSSCTIFTANIAEVGHSPAKKRKIKPEAILQDCVDIVDQNGRRLAFFRGSKYAAGSGPTVLQSKVRYERQVEHKLQELGHSLDFLDEMETEINQDPGPSGSNNQPTESNNQPANLETGAGVKKKKRRAYSRVFNENYDRMKRLIVTIKAVLQDDENQKVVSLHVRQTTGLYSRGEDIQITMSQFPSCTCEPCRKDKGKSGKSLNSPMQVCAPQIWLRMRLFDMEVTDGNFIITQVYYSKEELANIFKNWKTPTIVDDRGPEDLRKLFEIKEKKNKPIIYYIEKIDANTVNRSKTCRSPIHGHAGFKLNELNNLYIRVDNALWVPSKAQEAFNSPVYLCATKVCARENLPLRCNIYKNRVPDIVKRSEHVHLTDYDMAKVFSEGFELV